MTEEPPTFEIAYTKPFIAELLRRFRRSGRFPWLGTLLRVVLPLALCGVIAWMVYPARHHLAGSRALRDAFPVAACLLVFVCFPSLQRWTMYNRARKSPVSRAAVRVQLTPGGVTTTTAVGNAQLAWAAFPKARQFDDGFLVFQGPRSPLWLPIRAMVAGQPAEVEELLRANIADFRRA